MGAAAKRYAHAIFDLATEERALDRVALEFVGLGKTLSASPELANALSNPVIPPTERKALMSAVVERMGMSPLSRNAVLLITDKGRTSILPEIASELSRLTDARSGVVRAEVVSAAALSESQYERLAATLQRMTGQKITLDRKIDAGLIGGVTVRVADQVFDGSVATRLKDLRAAMLPS
ncbi:MAG: ATP synthase F1 subunit delta [Deltaproteobacteria bacterium]|nr:ATP synthase F1 subunit delta [Deltaproteobacteria bacterium]